mmetsp:Transcript_23530/g.33005  ORF Transcript_23530/g.33005 Transcript_23530/m.33005 type:complete len:357 (-) Transcript_23530:130-1200(-)
MPELKDDEAPLELSELRPWVSSEERYGWLEEADAEEAKFKEELEREAHMNASNLFGDPDDYDSDEDEEGGQSKKKCGPNAGRVIEWTSSLTNPDGYGATDKVEEDLESKKHEPGGVHVKCIISDSWHGFGDVIWASARHVANLLADPEKCRNLMTPALRQHRADTSEHPLLSVSVLELGAGAGLPSWTAMRCGARVVCTDQSVPNRVRCMAESAQRNWREMKDDSHDDGDDVLLHAAKSRACPYDWGKPIDEVAGALSKDGNERFDIVIAADCCYMPCLHEELLDSIDMLMSERGVALIPFALHGNTKDDEVWGIVDRAKAKGFQVDILEPQQLTPPKKTMELKQGLVNTIRITRK